jgi:hypothetical protein
MKGRWAVNWVSWPQFSQFAGQLVSWTVPQNGDSGIEAEYSLSPSASESRQDVSIRLASTDQNGRSRDSLDTTVTISNTLSGTTAVEVSQSSPGIYTGVAKGLAPGVYEVKVQQFSHENGDLVASETSGVVVPYPGEYQIVENAAQIASTRLEDIANLGGGKVLLLSAPHDALVHNIPSQPLRVPLAPWLRLAAILLFPLDVATRRLSISWGDIRRKKQSPGKAGAHEGSP